MRRQKWNLKNGSDINWRFMYQLCSKESCCVFKNVSKSLMKVRHNMWFEDENESFNVEFIWNNNVIK